MTMKSRPTASRTARTVSTANRRRFSGVPPHRVGALVGPRREELVDEVALGAHDLDAVVTRLPGEPGGPGEGPDLPPHAAVAQRAGPEPRDRALHRRGRHAPRGVAVAPGVQDLQGDAATRLVHGIRHLAVLARLATRRQLRRQRVERALDGGGEPRSP